jgi:hypothetical protein
MVYLKTVGVALVVAGIMALLPPLTLPYVLPRLQDEPVGLPVRLAVFVLNWSTRLAVPAFGLLPPLLVMGLWSLRHTGLLEGKAEAPGETLTVLVAWSGLEAASTLFWITLELWPAYAARFSYLSLVGVGVGIPAMVGVVVYSVRVQRLLRGSELSSIRPWIVGTLASILALLGLAFLLVPWLWWRGWRVDWDAGVSRSG